MPIRRTHALAPALLAATLVLAGCTASEADPNRSSSAGLPPGNIAAGGELAQAKGAATGQSCIDCHGADGNAPIDDSYPKLGGQYADYLAQALKAYRDGRRDHVLMSLQAKALTDQQIADLAAWFGARETQLVTLEGQHRR